MLFSGPVRDLFQEAYNNISLRVNQTILDLGGQLELPLNEETSTQRHQQNKLASIMPSVSISLEQHINKSNNKRSKRQTVLLVLQVTGFVVNMFKDGVGIARRVKNPNTNELYNEMLKIEGQLGDISKQLTEVTNDIKVDSIRAQYLSAQRIIYESLRISTYYLNMTETPTGRMYPDVITTQDDIDFWLDEFKKWGSLLRENINFLMDGWLGRGMIAGDILKTIVDVSGVY